MKAIIVTGTPGTGKTTVAKQLARRLHLKYIDVNRVVAKHKLSEGRDRKRACEIVDAKKLAKVLVHLIDRSRRMLVIDSHLSQSLPKAKVEACIVTKCGLAVLKQRLTKRGYSEHKIRENLDSEIFDVCLFEAEDQGHRVLVVRTDAAVDYRLLAENFK